MIDATMHKLGDNVGHGIVAAANLIHVKAGKIPTLVLIHESDYERYMEQTDGLFMIEVKRSISVLPGWCAVGWEEEKGE